MKTGIRLKEKSTPVGEKLSGIAHPHRVAIVYLLAHHNFAMHEIVENIDIPSNLVAHHLKLLLDSGWIRKRKTGKTVTYELKRRTFTDIYKFLTETPFGLKYFT